MKNKTLIRSAYGEKQKVTLTTLDARVEQCHKDECDINKIIAKYDRTGVLTHVNNFEARYEDLTGLDYQTMLNTVANANSMFEGLPSEIRNQFANDPAKFISFMDDENNNEQMYEMGLKQRPISTLDDGAKATGASAPIAEGGDATNVAKNADVSAQNTAS